MDKPSTITDERTRHKSGSPGTGSLSTASTLSEGIQNPAVTEDSPECAPNQDGVAATEKDGSMESGPGLADKDPWTSGFQLLLHFNRYGDIDDLQQAIAIFEKLSTPALDDQYRTGLANLGIALFQRFKLLGKLGDIECAISVLRDAVDLIPHDDPQKTSRYSNLGSALLTRFERLGELSDLDNAISRYRDAVHLTPLSHPDRPGFLNNFANSLFTRFQQLGGLSDLEDAISGQRNVVDLTPDSHFCKPIYLNNLGNFLKVRFESSGELIDLDDAISRHKEAVDLTPSSHPDKPSCLSNLGSSLRARFRWLGNLTDLDDAISALRKAVELIPRVHPHKLACLYNLGDSLFIRFEYLGGQGDIEDAAFMLRNTVDMTPRGHHDKPKYLNALVQSLLARSGERRDVEDAIFMLREAVDIIPRNHLSKPSCLDSLTLSLFACYERFGELRDLEDAVVGQMDVVDLTPVGHAQRPARLSNLGTRHLARFQRLGDLGDLEAAISRLSEAVDITPHNHPEKPALLDNLGNCFLARFERFGTLSDLEEAISKRKVAVNLIPHGHPDKPMLLNNLGNSFKARFELLGEPSDLDDTISALSNAANLMPRSHPHKPACLSNLGCSLIARFKHICEQSDLENAITMLRGVVDHVPHDHPSLPIFLNNLGNSFMARFWHLGELRDLEDAILRYRDAVDLTPDSHLDKSDRLRNLGDSFLVRFDRLGQLCDLEDAISRHQCAVNIIPDGHPHKPSCLYKLGNSIKARFERNGDPGDLEQVISLYSRAASAPTGPISLRFRASRQWISCTQHVRHHSLLHACSVAVGLLPQLAWIGLSLTRRYAELAQGVNVVREAAAVALDFGFPEKAVEWLEQGRSIVWGDLFQLRSSYEELSSDHPDHARRLQELSAALEQASATEERLTFLTSNKSKRIMNDIQESLSLEADKHRMLAIERDTLLQEIRQFPGFERFLLHKEFSRLRSSAHSGPVVILNAAENRCDALIVLVDVDRVLHVPLPNFNFQRCSGLRNMLEKLLGHARGDDREGERATRAGVNWESLLSVLWMNVVKPILDALDFTVFKQTEGELRRIFWCPTGPFVFLPIHAAGLYGAQHLKTGYKVSDFVVSSYVPTLSVLMLSRDIGMMPSTDARYLAIPQQSSGSDNVPSRDLRLLVVRQPPSDGLPQLPGVDTELGYIRGVINNSPSGHTILTESSLGTVEEVLSLMKEADWVHFACHGIQDAANPIDSGLCLADGRRLQLRDIIALSRPRGGLAFLSACQTAMGDERLSDEAIHVAAGMLFAGYGGVVGTMWSISDKLAPDVARDIYKQLFQNGRSPDYREAARALHGAIEHLRLSGRASFVTWLPFIHVGL